MKSSSLNIYRVENCKENTAATVSFQVIKKEPGTSMSAILGALVQQKMKVFCNYTFKLTLTGYSCFLFSL